MLTNEADTGLVLTPSEVAAVFYPALTQRGRPEPRSSSTAATQWWPAPARSSRRCRSERERKVAAISAFGGVGIE